MTCLCKCSLLVHMELKHSQSTANKERESCESTVSETQWTQVLSARAVKYYNPNITELDFTPNSQCSSLQRFNFSHFSEVPASTPEEYPEEAEICAVPEHGSFQAFQLLGCPQVFKPPQSINEAICTAEKCHHICTDR